MNILLKIDINNFNFIYISFVMQQNIPSSLSIIIIKINKTYNSKNKIN